MDRNFYDNNDFEEFLKQKADQYKMYPSDRVWNNIYSSLHGRNWRLALMFTLIFIGSAFFATKQLVSSNYQGVATRINRNPQLATAHAPVSHNISQYLSPDPKKISLTGKTVNHKTIVNSTGASTAARILPLNNGGTARGANQVFGARVGNAGVEPVTAGEGETLVIEHTGNNIRSLDIVANRAKPVALGSPAATLKNSALPKNLVSVNTLKDIPATALLQHDASSLKAAKMPKWFLQLYASPIISYRRLSNESQPDLNVSVTNSYSGNINKYVHHKPAPGLELGGRIQYKLSGNLSVYGGVQLNYSRYYIDAYRYRVEKASIALKSSSAIPDTVSGYTTIRNFSGYAPEQLQNQYWQLSVPLGLEIKLLGNKKLQFNVAGGVQPTFLLHSNSYLISSDYKNYIQSPDLARSFNVHTNFEAFVSYQAGGFKWQFGPQFRSQLLSSYSNQYRVREYLTEFGIKFGITKTLR